MILPVRTDRSWNKATWRYFQRLRRCMDRAIRESGSLDIMIQDSLMYGRGIYLPEDAARDAARTAELMRGLKPQKED